MLTTERYAPSFSGKGAFGPSFRLAVGIGIIAGVGLVYQRSCCTLNRARASRDADEGQYDSTAIPRTSERLIWTCRRWLRK